MHKKLKEIVKKTKEDLLKRKKDKPIKEIVSEPVRIFAEAVKKKSLSIIAEVKLASPSEKKLGEENEIILRVKEYQKAGADAISIVTEKHFFKGNPEYVGKIKESVSLPVLQKDFILDKYQLYEAKNAGADAILLIAGILSKKNLISLVKKAKKIGLEPVVEINSGSDLNKALLTNTKIIAVNARNLNSFKVDVDKACKLLAKIPQKYIKLGFSGVLGRQEVEKYQKAGADAILVGTSLMKTKKIKQFISSLHDNSTKVKICATRTLDAAKVSADCGAEFLGMVFTPLVKTHTVDMNTAKKIGKEMKGKINLVGVFQNMPISKVKKIIKDCNLDYVQFHGDETPEYINQFKIKKIKAFRFPEEFDVKDAIRDMKRFNVDFYLVDRIKQSEGPMLNLKKVGILSKEFPLILAGGLNPDNVVKIIKEVKPKIVDVASGVETNGQQDIEKIKKFIRNSKGRL